MKKKNSFLESDLTMQLPLDNFGGNGFPIVAPETKKLLAPAEPTIVYETYWKFAQLRQDIFYKRVNNLPPPWTADKILLKFKFTNVFRATDRVSQYLIKNVIYNDSFDSSGQEIFFRIILFKFFNKIETWELLRRNGLSMSWSDFNFDEYDRVLESSLCKGNRIFSAAYIMPSGCSRFGNTRKHKNGLELIRLLMKDEVWKKLSSAKRMQDAFSILKGYPMLGEFLAYQFLIDINYSTLLNFSENDFVVPGPGAKSGIAKCFSDLGGLTQEEIVKLIVDMQDSEFKRLNLSFGGLFGRKLHLIDCQNIFCEVDKYSRIYHPQIRGLSGRTKIKQLYTPSYKPLPLFFPPKWQINFQALS